MTDTCVCWDVPTQVEDDDSKEEDDASEGCIYTEDLDETAVAEEEGAEGLAYGGS